MRFIHFFVVFLSLISGTGYSFQIIVTSSDLHEFQALVKQFNQEVKGVYDSFSSDIPFEKISNLNSYKALLNFGHKLIPFFVKQVEFNEDSNVIIGSVLADRKITNLPDLKKYQDERNEEKKKLLPAYIEFPGDIIIYDKRIKGFLDEKTIPASASVDMPWLLWWENYHDLFFLEFPLSIRSFQPEEASYYPHISTTVSNGSGTITAVSASYQQIIERMAAEFGIPVFLGETSNLDVQTTLRMRSVTFEEFAYLVGLTVGVKPFPYQVHDGSYHFGGSTPSKPRRFMNGWGISMGKTVFNQGEGISVIIITRGVGPMVSPQDPAFISKGSFCITDNIGRKIRDFSPISSLSTTLPPFYRLQDCTRMEVKIEDSQKLPPGEFSVKFKYETFETPIVSFEIYGKSNRK